MSNLYLVVWSGNYSPPSIILCGNKEEADRAATLWKKLCKDEDGDRIDVYLIDTEKKTIVEVKS